MNRKLLNRGKEVKREVFGIALLLFAINELALNVQPIKAGQWVPYVPDSEKVDMVFWTVNETAYVKVTITYPVLALNVSDWGKMVRNYSHFTVNSEVWFLISDVYLQVVQVLSYTYDLGQLEEGNYCFTFLAWSCLVKSISFTVGLPCDLNYDGKVNVMDIFLVAKAFGSYPTHTRWNPVADVNNDHKVDVRDLFIMAKNFGKTF